MINRLDRCKTCGTPQKHSVNMLLNRENKKLKAKLKRVRELCRECIDSTEWITARRKIKEIIGEP